jgi:hypothetical protein
VPGHSIFGLTVVVVVVLLVVVLDVVVVVVLLGLIFTLPLPIIVFAMFLKKFNID